MDLKVLDEILYLNREFSPIGRYGQKKKQHIDCTALDGMYLD